MALRIHDGDQLIWCQIPRFALLRHSAAGAGGALGNIKRFKKFGVVLLQMFIGSDIDGIELLTRRGKRIGHTVLQISLHIIPVPVIPRSTVMGIQMLISTQTSDTTALITRPNRRRPRH
ncbi:Uncharacterised protein [Mycobacteroides abscessus subsp. abscessus]|nr:Uncharacterised protein [Mycobacteroides abscessus subsp. abscessus]